MQVRSLKSERVFPLQVNGSLKLILLIRELRKTGTIILFDETVKLPGSMAENGKGDDVTSNNKMDR